MARFGNYPRRLAQRSGGGLLSFVAGRPRGLARVRISEEIRSKTAVLRGGLFVGIFRTKRVEKNLWTGQIGF